jgi:GNAT superfamily N-acetyltransferase
VAGERYIVEPLGRQHDRATFACGVEVLDRYLREQASQDQRRHVAAVFVLVDQVDRALAGYYTLSAASIELIDLPPEVARRLPRYPVLPALLIGRLAVDRRRQGQGLGNLLLADALKRCVRLHTELGAMAVLVDAKDDLARTFYERFGFQRLERQTRRLYLPMTALIGQTRAPA